MTVTKKYYQHPEYLIETEWLENNLDKKDLRIFDCSVHVVRNPDAKQQLQAPFIFESGRDEFEHAHIPNAGFIDIPSELSDSSSNFPLMMPSENYFSAAMSRYGVSDNTHVVLYSTTEANWATRVWWMLRACGFNNASVLNGGWSKWKKEARQISSLPRTYKPGEFISRPRPGFFVDKEQVLTAIKNNSSHIINALPAPLHTGTSDVVFGRKGRIRNSVNVPFNSLHDADTECYLPADQLHHIYKTENINESEHIITYCGGGIASSNTAFTLSLLGYENISVYDASMLEWGNDATLPMEIG
ncbi:MAG: sulfurtransferase [Gammaproteobacteria bacterium]|nr:MAG: sulfurtransferase [Gammaproteobacteria bacterium]